MKARPILFSGPMVRALLAGSKTQTRRIVKGVPSWDHYGRDIMDWGLSGIHQAEDHLVGTDRWALDVQTDVDNHSRRIIRCPYGVPGDLLIVRETTQFPGEFDDLKPTLIPERGRPLVVYVADGLRPGYGKQRPAIHMPRWASRLTLEVTEVRVERLQDISEADALAEGVRWSGCDNGQDYWSASWPGPGVRTHVFSPSGAKSASAAYLWLWDTINGPDSAASNPWVWAVSFKVHQQNVDAFLASH